MKNQGYGYMLTSKGIIEIHEHGGEQKIKADLARGGSKFTLRDFRKLAMRRGWATYEAIPPTVKEHL